MITLVILAHKQLNERLFMKFKIFFLILTILIYIPILLFTIFVIGISGIDNSCRFNDLTCLMQRPGSIEFYAILYLLNILFVSGIAFQFIKLVKKKKEINNGSISRVSKNV